jgi:hypothetical protein
MLGLTTAEGIGGATMIHRIRATAAAIAVSLAVAPWVAGAQEDTSGVIGSTSGGCTYNFGSGDFQWCISSTGSLQKLMSPNGAEHIAFGAIIEGNVLCVNNAALYYDRGGLINVAGWNPPTVVAGPTSSSVTVRLTSTDGVFQLDQRWTRDTVERDLTLQLTLQNISTVPTGPVRLMRLVDIDPNSNPSSAFDRSRYAVWFRSTDAVSIIALTLNPLPVVVVTSQPAISTTPPPCAPAPLATPNPANPGSTTTGVASISYDFPSLSAGQKKIVKIGYQVQ